MSCPSQSPPRATQAQPKLVHSTTDFASRTERAELESNCTTEKKLSTNMQSFAPEGCFGEHCHQPCYMFVNASIGGQHTVTKAARSTCENRWPPRGRPMTTLTLICECTRTRWQSGYGTRPPTRCRNTTSHFVSSFALVSREPGTIQILIDQVAHVTTD